MMSCYLHEQASLTTGSIPNYDKLSTDFRHRNGVEGGSGSGRQEILAMKEINVGRWDAEVVVLTR
jgi:hypothetical protein